MGLFGKSDADVIAEARTQAKMNNAIYFCVGDEGRFLTVYKDHADIRTKPSLLANYSGNGVKSIYYSDCNGVQFKTSPSGMVRGFLQLETGSMQKNENNFYSENSFVWNVGRKSEVTNELMEEIKNYIQEKIRASKNPHPSITTQALSPAEELKKFKELLDVGILTQEEFDAKKKQLLGL